ncbi:MAG: AAA family ATPase [Chloroflexi bacterium]|nr:AAA family ATPase [Chloroflexota bacterium]
MIKTLEIKNFKSIKQLRLDCKRINILIGEPNTGKSNILETLALFSFGAYFNYANFRQFIRFERMNNLFYDENLDEPVRIQTDNINFSLQFKQGRFTGEIQKDGRSLGTHYQGDYRDLNAGHSGEASKDLRPFKFYKFIVQDIFPQPESEFLLPPSGINLMSLILANKELRSIANEIFSNFGLQLNLRPQENKIEVLKRLEGITISYPYSLASDTLQRVVFQLFAVLSNKDSILVFEEPESHAFPYYTKYFAETIASDEKNNQYFISTHNPYLLLPLLEKAPKENVAVFITYFKDYQTKVKPLSTEEIQEIAEIDVFSNLDRFLEEK